MRRPQELLDALDRAEEIATAAYAPITVWIGQRQDYHFTLADSAINWESGLGWQPVAYVPIP